MKKSIVRAIVIDSGYKGLELASIHNVKKMSSISVELEGFSREYHPSIFAFVDAEGRKLTVSKSIEIVKEIK